MEKVEYTHRILDSVWHIQGYMHSDNTFSLIQYDRDTDEAIKVEGLVPKGILIEDADRIVTFLEVEGERYKITNPRHVFNYKDNREERVREARFHDLELYHNAIGEGFDYPEYLKGLYRSGDGHMLREIERLQKKIMKAQRLWNSGDASREDMYDALFK